MTLNDLQDFRQRDLYAMLRLPDEEFQDRLVSMGLLNGSMDCTCGLPMKKKESSRGVLEWQCNRAIHRPDELIREKNFPIFSQVNRIYN